MLVGCLARVIEFPARRWSDAGGLKPRFVINHKGQVMALKITPGNTADSTVLDDITPYLAGKLYADKGYISRALFNNFGSAACTLSPASAATCATIQRRWPVSSCCASASSSRRARYPEIRNGA